MTSNRSLATRSAALFSTFLLPWLVISTPALAAEGDTPNPVPEPIDRDRLARFVDEFFEREMAELEVPGVAFAFVDKAGGEPLLRGYGWADIERQVAMDPAHTVVRVGSVSKTVTALAALELVQQGRLELAADISMVLDRDGRPPLIPDTFDQPVTLFHLLSQTAGFGERLFGQHTLDPESHLPLRVFLERHLTPRLRPPGRVINYNDYQTALAGLMIETVERKPFPEAARQLVFEPLGMHSSTFEQVTLPADLESRLALAYRSGKRPLARDYVHTTPAAGLYTTAEDMSRLLAALLEVDGSGSADEAPSTGVSDFAVQAMKQSQFRHGPYMSGRGFGLAEDRLHGYRTLHKDGQCSGFTARVFLVPELGVGWFSVQNRSIFGRAGAIGPVNRLHRRLASALLGEFFQEGPGRDVPESATETHESTDPAAAKRLAGTYRDTMDPTSGWEGLFLVNEVEVEARADGSLRFLGLEPWHETTIQETGSRTYLLRQEDAFAFSRFIDNEAGSPQWVTFRAGAWQRVPFYRSGRFTRVAGATLLLLALSSLPVWLWRRRGAGRPLAAGASALTLAALVLLLYAVGLGTAMLTTDIQVLFSGVTPLLRLVFLLPVLALVAAVVGIVRLLRGQRAPASGSGERSSRTETVYWTAIAGANVALVVLLALNRAMGWPM